jgi:hypothetical protein
VSLYETWNLAFITGTVNYLQIYYPKLLIPAVIAADPLSYLSNRATSLWMSLNFRQFAAFSRKPDLLIPGKSELAKLWGEINLRYAQELVEEETDKNLEDFEGSLDITLAQIMEIIKKSLTSVPLTPEELERLNRLYE